MVQTKDKNRRKDITRSLSSKIFAKILYKTKFSKKKGNNFLYGIDLLKENVKQDLLKITALKVESVYSQIIEYSTLFPLRFNKKKGKTTLLLLLKKVCEEFLTQKYGYRIKINDQTLKKSLYTKKLLNDAEILFQIPLNALLNNKSSSFRLIYYPIYNYASEEFIEALIDNLILEISNCVVYFSVINFSSIYAFRQTLYKSKFLSLRNFERFKNNLTWQLRVKIYFQHPRDLYNNRYEVYILRTSGIYSKTVYANRSRELKSLTKFSLWTLLFIEIQDFLISRFDETLYITSRGLRFVFTSVLGQIIGLVWRGIIEGIKK